MTRTDGKRTRVALVGAGFIARAHLDALRWCPGVEPTALCDTSREAAEALARRVPGARVFTSLEELLEARAADAIHILTPPGTHAALARRCLEAGLPCLVEKPLALEAEEIRELGAAARQRGLALGVNHNYPFLPGMDRLRRDLAAGRLGRLEELVLVYRAPLRQLLTGDVGHFMFQSEANILWEQGVHLFSLVHALIGPAEGVRAVAGERRRLANGAPVQAAMAEATLLALGSDGTARLDLLRASYQRLTRTRWLEFADQGLTLLSGAAGLAAQGAEALLGYPLALFGLRPASEPFNRGMLGSLRAFHGALAGGRPAPVGAEAAEAVDRMCRLAAEAVGASREAWSPAAPSEPGPARPGEVVLTGGGGFIGRALAAALAGRPLTLLVRRPALLPERLRDPSIRIFAGDARDPAALARALEGAAFLVHLATCADPDPSRVEASMAAGARTAGEACLAAGVKRMLFVSSTAALYCGGRAPLTGSSGVDPRPGKRPEYARGKIAAERALEELRKQRGLPLVVLRPAIGGGSGGLAEHTGVGLWVRENHCAGWGMGRTPLPFVLVEDVARAIAAALEAPGIEGRAYNLAGGVRLSARAYIAALAAATGRAYRFHPTPLWVTWALEGAKALVKTLAGRKGGAMTRRDLRSRAFLARFDTADAEADLGWRPVSDPETFLARGVRVHAPAPRGGP